MIIAIQKGLDHIETQLISDGFTVVYFDECKHPVDFYIYFETRHYENNLNHDTFMNPLNVFNGSSFAGTQYINARGKAYNDIKKELCLLRTSVDF